MRRQNLEPLPPCGEQHRFDSSNSKPLDQFSAQVMLVTLNLDFFASVLGGRRDLGHHVIYFEPEMQWYFKDSDHIFKPTSPEKLQNQYRALMMKCAEAMPGQVHKLNLVHEFRNDKTAKAVVQRAKSILAADQSYFSATSPHSRVRGIELFERVARRFVDEMLCCEPGQILKLADAYTVFRGLLKERELPDIKRRINKRPKRVVGHRHADDHLSMEWKWA